MLKFSEHYRFNFRIKSACCQEAEISKILGIHATKVVKEGDVDLIMIWKNFVMLQGYQEWLGGRQVVRDSV